MKRCMMLWMVAVLVAACGGSEGEATTAADTLSRAQKDSIVAGLPIPGASAVGRAMDARDRANTRTGTHDTIR